MLGKLFKYEFKNTSKTMLTTYAVLAVATLMGSLALYKLDRGWGDQTFLLIISAVMVFAYVIAIVGIYCIDFIYLCNHYHKTMYSSQGYLTHTLPVSPAATFSVKVLTIFAWMLLSTVLSIVSFLVLLLLGSGGELARVFSDFSWTAFAMGAREIFGMEPGTLIFLFVLAALVETLWSILWILTSMAVGQLFQKNRTIFSVLTGFAIYMISQIASSLFLAVNGYSTGLFLGKNLSSFMTTVIGGGIAITTVYFTILWGICIYINKKRLNLE